MLLVGGIAAIIVGIIQGMWFGVGRGILMVGVSSWWLKTGADRIAKARLQQLGKKLPPSEFNAIKAKFEEEKAEEEHKLKQAKGDEARHWLRK